MNRGIKYTLFLILISFIFIFNVNAECSYQERKDLLKEANSVDISVEPIDNGNNIYSFKFNLVNLAENVFIEYSNTNNGEKKYIFYSDTENGIYSFVDNESYLTYSYNFTFYSKDDNCSGDKVTSKTVKKPMYNVYSENINCTYENNKNFKYCKKFMDTDYKLTNEKFYKELEKYNNVSYENNNNDVKSKNNFKVIIVFVISCLIIIFMLVFMAIKNKKNKL